ARADDSPSGAAQQVRAALEADLAGARDQRNSLLRSALAADPTLPEAHWHSGSLEFEGAWRSIDEIASMVAGDARRREYADRRDGAGVDPEAHRDLARWCVKQGLDAEARHHWGQVLLGLPGDGEARERLGLREFRGGLFTHAQVERWQKRDRQLAADLKTHLPGFMALLRTAASGGQAERDAAVAAIREVSDPAALPAAMQAVSQKAPAKNGPLGKLPAAVRESLVVDLHVALIDALEATLLPEATVDLVYYAVFSPWEPVRRHAAAALRSRPLTDYVPLMMSGLRAPVESETDVFAAPDGTVRVTTTTSVTRPEGRSKHTQATNFETVGAINRNVGRSNPAAVLARHLGRAEALVEAAEAAAESVNEDAAYWNARIVDALRIATGKEDLPTDAESWWSAWLDYNELYSSDQEQELETYAYQDFAYYYPQAPPRYDRNDSPGHSYREPRAAPPRYHVHTSSMVDGRAVSQSTGEFAVTPISAARMSCFAAGTPVWTAAGPRPIEELEVGDQVLSQDPRTGELAFRPVMAVTIRPATELVRVEAGDDSIVATRGHRFWVDGHGWEMAKFLAPGQRLHSVAGGAPISAAAAQRTDEPIEAFNLVVDDFHTYFVGESRLLVCDNSCPEPTLAATPGLTGRPLPAAPWRDELATTAVR
ncbi:MAG TPA: polymorphic toxin-type HINT domain-containing protein, partial [Lacipirellulaceae bacterium]|nr:polymorphic toxin-type HINT domain-containing protein [Lacipirellulaceae bacterium]